MPDQASSRVDEALLMGADEEAIPLAIDEVAAEEAVIAAELAAAETPKEETLAPVSQKRFNQVYAERKALADEVAMLRAQQQEVVAPVTQVVAPVTPADTQSDIKALRKEINAAQLEIYTESDDDRIAIAQDKIDIAQDKIDALLIQRAETNIESRMGQQSEINQFNTKAAELQVEFPILHNTTGNPEAIDMVVALRDSYIAKGMPITEALDKAAAQVAPLFAGQAAPVAGVQDARTLAAIKRGANAANSVPLQEGGVGNRAQEQANAGKDISQQNWGKMSRADRDAALAA